MPYTTDIRRDHDLLAELLHDHARTLADDPTPDLVILTANALTNMADALKKRGPQR